MTPEPVSLSVDFLLAVRRGDGEARADCAARLAGLDDPGVAGALDTDRARVAFWLNVYNAVAQRALATDPSRYEHRREFFSAKTAAVAGQPLSLDAIEHGILRRSYHKYTLGYLRVPGPFRSAFADRHAPDERDPRVHFALNCGAESCPPIAAYTREAVDDQLDRATRGYLDQHVEYDSGSDEALVPRVMLWFRGDFGGKRGVYEFLGRYDQIPWDATPTLSYREWDWTLDPAAFDEDVETGAT